MQLTITVYYLDAILLAFHILPIFIKIKKLFIKGFFCAFVSFKIRNQNLLLKHIQKKVYNNSINISIIPMNVIIIIYIKYQILASMFSFHWMKPKPNIINQILQYQIIIHESAIRDRKQCGITKSMQEFYCPNCQVFKLECAECFEKMRKCNNHQRVNLKKFCQYKSIQYTSLSKDFQIAQKYLQEQLKQKPEHQFIRQITQLYQSHSTLYKQFRRIYEQAQKNYLTNLKTVKTNKAEKLKKEKQKVIYNENSNNYKYQFYFNNNKQKVYQQTLRATINQIYVQIIQIKSKKQQQQNHLRQMYYNKLIQNLLLKSKSNSSNMQKISLIKILSQRQIQIKQLQNKLRIMSSNLTKYSEASSLLFRETIISKQEPILNNNGKINQLLKNQQNKKQVVIQEVVENYKNQIIELKKDKTELSNKLQNQKIQYQNKLIQQKRLYDNQIVINNLDDQKIQNYQKNINQQKVKQLEQLKIKYGRLNQQVDRITNQNNLIKQQGITKDKEITNLKNQIQNIQNEKNKNMASLQKYIKNEQQLENTMQVMKNTHQQEKQKLEHYVAEYLQKISKLQKQKKELELYVQKQPQRIQKENQKIEQQHKIKYQQKILQQKQKFQQLSTKYQQRISQLQNKKQQLQLKITKLQQEKQKLKLRITKLQSDEQKLLKRIDELSSEQKQLQKINSKLQSEKQHLEKQQQKLRSQSLIMIQKQKSEIMFQSQQFTKKLQYSYNFWTNLLSTQQQKIWLLDNIKSKIQFSKTKLIFVASHHKFSSEDFHRLCDEKQNLLVLVKCPDVNNKPGHILGGFTKYKFGAAGDQNIAFIFSVTHLSVMNLNKGKKATFSDKQYGPIFGDDFKIRFQKIYSNYHIVKSSYQKRTEGVSKDYLCGGIEVPIEDYEVHQLII